MNIMGMLKHVFLRGVERRKSQFALAEMSYVALVFEHSKSWFHSLALESIISIVNQQNILKQYSVTLAPKSQQ
jgi:hypothetical protein